MSTCSHSYANLEFLVRLIFQKNEQFGGKSGLNEQKMSVFEKVKSLLLEKSVEQLISFELFGGFYFGEGKSEKIEKSGKNGSKMAKNGLK
ncbi:MAG: hypothetical protein Q4F38_03790 [Akkermansia sp.]|nr:hypothetical protein [Akkermansia sp.]